MTRSHQPGLARSVFAAIAVLTLGATGFLVTPAAAAPADDQLVSDNPANFTPRVLDGKVMTIVRSGDTMIVGGNFTQVREADAAAPVLTRVGVFAFNATTGVIDTNFVPQLAAATPEKKVLVNALAVTSDGNSVYVGGEYRTINGIGPARLQAVHLADGQKLQSFDNDVPNKSVFDLKLVGDRLYVSGAFTKVGTTPRGGLATMDPGTGALTTAVTTSFTGINRGGIPTVRKIDVTPSGDRLIAIGNFTTVAGVTRTQVAMLDTSGAAATVAGWSTNRFPTGCSGSFDTYLRDVDFAPDGSFFVIVTTGGWGQTNPSTSSCDSASRFETYRTGVQDYTWIDHTGGDTFWAVEVTNRVAYVGGHFRWFNNTFTPSGGSTPGPGAVAREGIGALDTRNGLPFSWDPGRQRGVGVFDFLVTQTHLWAGSDTASWGGERRERLAAFPFAGGAALPADRLGTLPGDVVQLDPEGTGIDPRARYLTGTGTPVTTNPVGAESWSSARGAVMIDNKVYSGWSDGTFKVRTFDGVSFGAPSNVPLNGLSFGSDLSNMTSMFYDRRDGRLYYTLPGGSGGLYYRYFTPESGVVGTVRFDQLRAASVTAIDAANIKGAFLVGDQLHFVDKNGVLKKITFNGGAFTGPVSTVNSTIDWRARGVFLSTAASASAPNTPPTAAYTVDCFGLDCTFDGATSTDSDGSIVNYAWDFAGEDTGSGQQAAHTFAAAGTYPVTLTVTDNRTGTDSVTTDVIVAPVDSSIVFSDSNSYGGNGKAVHTWDEAVPTGVQNGDTMLLFVSGSTAAEPTTPTGWTLEEDVLDSDTRTVVFSKTADGGDVGAALEVTWWLDGVTKSTVTVMSLTAYSGVASIESIAGTIEGAASSRAAHAAPDTSVPADGDWVLSYWSDKNASTTDWSEPFGQQVRAEPVPPVGGATTRVTGLLTDDGAPAAAGPRAGLVATANGQATKATMFTVVLASN